MSSAGKITLGQRERLTKQHPSGHTPTILVVVFRRSGMNFARSPMEKPGSILPDNTRIGSLVAIFRSKRKVPFGHNAS